MNTSSGKPVTASAWPAAFVGAFLHGIVWAPVLLLLTVYVPMFTQRFSNFNMKLPAVTEGFVSLSKWVYAYWYLALAALVVLVLIDAVVLRALDRPGAVRVRRELWSGLALGLPVVALMFAGAAVIVPSIKLIEALERDRKPVPAAAAPAVPLTLEGSHVTWVRNGQE